MQNVNGLVDYVKSNGIEVKEFRNFAQDKGVCITVLSETDDLLKKLQSHSDFIFDGFEVVDDSHFNLFYYSRQ